MDSNDEQQQKNIFHQSKRGVFSIVILIIFYLNGQTDFDLYTFAIAKC